MTGRCCSTSRICSATRLKYSTRRPTSLDPGRRLLVEQPRGIAVSKTNEQIYVAAIDTFHAFDEDGSPAFQLSLQIPAAPGVISRGGYRVVLSPDHQFAYLTEEAGAAVEVIDVLAGQSIARIDMPPDPRGIVISPDGARLYVGHGDGAAAISVIDTGIPALIDSIAVGQAVNRLALSPDGQTLYLNSQYTGRLLKVDTRTQAIADSLSLGQATDLGVQIRDVALSADGTRLAASLSRTLLGFDALGNPPPVLWGGIAVVDTRTWTQTAEIFLGVLVANIGIAPDGKTLYVAGLENFGNGGYWQFANFHRRSRERGRAGHDSRPCGARGLFIQRIQTRDARFFGP